MRDLSYIIGQITGVLSGVGVCLLWNFAMWGPTSILSLSGTSFSGAFIMSILAIVAVIASAAPTNRELGLVDYLIFAAATVAIILIYGAYNQLLVNNNQIGAWRNNLERDADG